VKPHLHVRALLVVVLALAGTIAGSVSASGGGTKFTVSSSVGSTAMKGGMTLSGSVTWIATPSTTTAITKVEFVIDGTLRWTEKLSPYQFNGDGNQLDTTALSDGSHTLKVQAYRSDGKVASTSATVSVSNKPKPPPPPSPPAFTTTSSIQNGATLSGSVTWTALPSGATVSQVDFLVDGTVKWTEKLSPYYFNGDGKQLDTTTLSNGGHTLSVNAYSTGGQKASASSSVTISNSTASAPPPLTVSTNVANGATLSGSVTWTASPSGGTISKVEFLVDGTVKSTDSSAPYQYNGDGGTLDTTALANGGHTLAAKATATDSRTAAASSSVTVSNASAAPPPPAPAAGSIPRFGIATGYGILQRSPADQAFELDQIKAVGAKLVRFDSLPGNQAQVDPVVNGVLARGMEPMLVLFGTTNPISPSTAAAFAGSQAAKWKGKVRLYEFANEPDLNGWTGTTYAQALIPVYNAIKAADPNAIVIAGALWKGGSGPVQFVTDMYNAGAKGHFDVLSMHLYDDPFASGTWNVWNLAFHLTPSVRSVMDAHGDQAIPIGSTESGGPVDKYGEAGQATIVAHDFDALASDPRLAFVCVYSMMDDPVVGFGLLRPDHTRRPAWTVYHDRAAAF
jgi:Bacterial Ig domain/Cellulase (glycosyl hydrolase family 5)